MKFPKHTATQSLTSPTLFYQGSAEGKDSGNIEMMKFNYKCSAKCAAIAGLTALECMYCGFNIACWLSCAGPEVAGCIKTCIK